ncbi:cob(I)yrinic acid a,c-diamide adenosyltransferase [Clostridium rectalis]|uniref:cob(I)yrinic acid a,c-diamide adenosyltransferase n=1 Tax=Clostridium rectalis TaxID=2040295 RepID=UPI000F64237F|nr:cob(I)yrinic acid a,c-diamide adenosyltransferase [Clostridium rectalis]
MFKIYTKTGDKGETGLFGGSRVGKDDLIVEVYGTIDEANSLIGVAYSVIKDKELREILRIIQKKLFILGAEFASDDKGKKMLKNKISKEDILFLEGLIDKYMVIVGPLKDFVIPGDTTGSAYLHVARTVIRRAERNIVKLSKKIEIREETRQYVNRLSDVLFSMARLEVERE